MRYYAANVLKTTDSARVAARAGADLMRRVERVPVQWGAGDSLVMRTALLLLCFVILASGGFAATDVRVDFTLNAADAYGAPLQQNRFYWVYRPDNLPKTTPVPMILVMDSSPATFLHRKADQAGFVVVSCSFSGNSTGTPGTVWNSDNPRITGFEDYDYTTEVINRVRASENCNDAFITGLSKGGHMALAYACERPSMIKAASSLDEFMGLTSNIPSAPTPIIVFQGASDTSVPYAMVKDTVDAWRAIGGLLNATPVTTY
jgi:poly(3-hydroxybutyrate) depolymerase